MSLVTVGVCPDASRATLNALWDAMGPGGPFNTPVVTKTAPDDPNEPATHWCFQGFDSQASYDLYMQMSNGEAMPVLPDGVEYGVNGVPSLADATAACLTMGIYAAGGNGAEPGYGAAGILDSIGKKIRTSGGW